MKELDFRGKSLGDLFRHMREYPANRYHIHSINHVHRLVEDSDIERCRELAPEQGAEVMTILNYGIDWYIPSLPSSIIYNGR